MQNKTIYIIRLTVCFLHKTYNHTFYVDDYDTNEFRKEWAELFLNSLALNSKSANFDTIKTHIDLLLLESPFTNFKTRYITQEVTTTTGILFKRGMKLYD